MAAVAGAGPGAAGGASWSSDAICTRALTGGTRTNCKIWVPFFYVPSPYLHAHDPPPQPESIRLGRRAPAPARLHLLRLPTSGTVHITLRAWIFMFDLTHIHPNPAPVRPLPHRLVPAPRPHAAPRGRPRTTHEAAEGGGAGSLPPRPAAGVGRARARLHRPGRGGRPALQGPATGGWMGCSVDHVVCDDNEEKNVTQIYLIFSTGDRRTLRPGLSGARLCARQLPRGESF